MENLENNETRAPSSLQTEAEVTLISATATSENADSSVEIIEPNVELVDLTTTATPSQPSTSGSNSAGAVGSSNIAGAAGGSGLTKTNLEAAFKDGSTHNTGE